MNINIMSFKSFAETAINQHFDDKAVLKFNDDNNGFVDTKWQRLTRRHDDYKEQNKLVRQALVDSLLSTFGVATLDKLPKCVRDELKIRDFKLDKEGKVHSHRPLTAHRIIAITNAVAMVNIIATDNGTWPGAAEQAKATIASSTLVTFAPDKNKALNDLDRLFDSTRPYSQSLKAETFKEAAKLMLGMYAKPFHARLALECLANILDNGINVPASGSTAEKIQHISRQVGDAVSHVLCLFKPKVNNHFAFTQKHPKASSSEPAFIKDGITQPDLNNEDTITVTRMVSQLLQKQCPGVADLVKDMKNVSLDKFYSSREAIKKDLTALMQKHFMIINVFGTQLRFPEANTREAEVMEKFNGMLIAKMLLTDLYLQSSGSKIFLARINKNDPQANPLKPTLFNEAVEAFNNADTKTFNVDDMFVKKGKKGIENFHPQLKKNFSGLDLGNWAQRFQTIVKGMTQLKVLEQMAHGMKNDGNKEFERDYDRASAILDGGDNLMPNKHDGLHNTDKSAGKMYDAFAQKLRRNPNVTYAELTPIEKAKVILTEAMLQQFFETLPMEAQMAAMSPNSNSQSINAMFASTESHGLEQAIYKFSFDDDGGLSVSVFRYQSEGGSIGLGIDAQKNLNGDLTAKPIKIVNRLDMHIAPEEVNRFAGLKWESFDIQKVTNTYNQNKVLKTDYCFENIPEQVIPEDYRLDMEVTGYTSFTTDSNVTFEPYDPDYDLNAREDS